MKATTLSVGQFGRLSTQLDHKEIMEHYPICHQGIEENFRNEALVGMISTHGNVSMAANIQTFLVINILN